MSVPDDVAQSLAVYHRNEARTAPTPGSTRWHAEMADLLDPPPTLRKQVERVLNNAGAYSTDRDHTDAVLTVVADWLAAQPMPYPDVVTRGQRDHDVALIRRGAS